MPRVLRESVQLELRSLSSGQSIAVIQKTMFREKRRSNGPVERVSMRSELIDPDGRTLEFAPGNRVRCVASGETYVIEQRVQPTRSTLGHHVSTWRLPKA